VCECCNWESENSPAGIIAKEQGLRLYTGESYKARDIFGETSFSLDDLIPPATEKQIREMAAIEAW